MCYNKKHRLPFVIERQFFMDENLKNRRLSYGMSNGLRTLHDAGILKMEHFLDQKDIWTLYPLSVHPIRDTVTNITIGGK